MRAHHVRARPAGRLAREAEHGRVRAMLRAAVLRQVLRPIGAHGALHGRVRGQRGRGRRRVLAGQGGWRGAGRAGRRGRVQHVAHAVWTVGRPGHYTATCPI